MKDVSFLKQLALALAPSSYEVEVAQLVRKKLQSNSSNCFVDSMGNTAALNSTQGELVVMLSAHTDEIGLQVIGYTEDGLLMIRRVGGMKPVFDERQEVCLLLNGGVKMGEIVSRNVADNKKHTGTEWDSLYIDIGANSRSEARELVSIGTLATYKPNFSCIGENITSKSLDDRVGVFIVCSVFKQLANKLRHITLIAATTTQEEIGLRGMASVAARYQPDICINFDVVDGVREDNGRLPILGCGAALVRNADSNPLLNALIENAAIKAGLPFQFYAGQEFTGGNDASRVQIFANSTATANIGIPCIGVHSNREECHLADIESAIELASAIILDLELRKGNEESIDFSF